MKHNAVVSACRTDVNGFGNAAALYSAQKPAPAFPETLREFEPLLKNATTGDLSRDGLILTKAGYILQYDALSGTVIGTLKGGQPCS